LVRDSFCFHFSSFSVILNPLSFFLCLGMGSLTQKMGSDGGVSVFIIPTVLARDNPQRAALGEYKLATGLTVLGRGFGHLQISDSRVSRHHLEAMVSSTSPPTLTLTPHGRNPSLLRPFVIEENAEVDFIEFTSGKPVQIKDNTEIAFLPDKSNRFVIRIF